MADNLSKSEEQKLFLRQHKFDPYVHRQLPVLVAEDGDIDFKGVASWGDRINNFTTTTPGFPKNQLPENKKSAKPRNTSSEHIKSAQRALSARDMPSSHRRTPITQTNLLKAGMKFSSNPESKFDQDSTTQITD